MKSPKILPPPHYDQPDSEILPGVIRSVNGSQEYVDFVAESHLRIWHNTQTEGYANHYHNAMEIIVCLEKQYVVFSCNRTYVLNAGDILLIPPFLLHELKGMPCGSRFIFLINIEMLRCFQDIKTLDPVLMEPYLCTAASHPEIYEHMHDCLMQMTDLYFSHDIFWETSIYALLLDLFTTIGRNYFDNASSNSDKAPRNKRQHFETFANLLSYIDAHYTEDLTLEQVASYIGFSKYHFARLFKEHTNTTFHNYLCHKRIHAAQSMLTADQELPITDIAFQIGFNNLTTFSRCFHKYALCSPTEYRNKLRREEV